MIKNKRICLEYFLREEIEKYSAEILILVLNIYVSDLLTREIS